MQGITNKAFFIEFKHTSYSLYTYPIRVHQYERKLSVNGLVELLKKKGFIYEFFLLRTTLQGKSFANFNLQYFTHIYHVLGLPLPTPDYLYKSWLRWEEIKKEKKQRTIENKALKLAKQQKSKVLISVKD